MSHQINNRATTHIRKRENYLSSLKKVKRLTRQEKDLEMFKTNFANHPERGELLAGRKFAEENPFGRIGPGWFMKQCSLLGIKR
jgi:hypothetical protein